MRFGSLLPVLMLTPLMLTTVTLTTVTLTTVTLTTVMLMTGTTLADEPKLAFEPAGEGYYQFDTGVLKGKLRLDGRSQGVASLIDVKSGMHVAHGGGLPGVLSLYRIFSDAKRYGHAARDWPTESKLLDDGAVEVRWPPADDHPLQITAVYRIAAPDTIDLECTVKPLVDMPRFELFLSSYFGSEYRALVYVKPSRFAGGPSILLPADVNPMVDGTYLMFPRDLAAAQMTFDGRWEFPPNPVQWSVTRWLAGPMAVRRDEKSGVTAVLMAPPQDCFAVSMPYNRTPPDGVSGHNSLYLSLYGQDLKAGQTAKAHTRLVVGKISDQQAIELYEAYLDSRKE